MTHEAVVLGGGFGGLEAAFYLRWRAGNKIRVTLVSAVPGFYFKPNSIYIPFGLDPQRLMLPLEPAARRAGIRLLVAAAEEVDPARGRILLRSTTQPVLNFDSLIVATGAAMRAHEIPGLAEHALGVWSAEEMLTLRQRLQRLLEEARQGLKRKVLFLVPPNNRCSGPLYELVFMLDTWLRRHGARQAVEIAYATYERGYIQAFGPRLDEVVREEFDKRGVAGYRALQVEEVLPGKVRFVGGEQFAYDLLISFPPYVASTAFPGLPTDDRGFLRTDLASRRVAGHSNVFAVGDASDFPVKQAFLAMLQAGAAAEQIATGVLGQSPTHVFQPESMCIMEQFDTATFARVPLRLTGDPSRPVEVNGATPSGYKVGSSPLWRAGKKLLGLYLPWRFRNGHPFHAGWLWKSMEVGLRGMAAVLAR